MYASADDFVGFRLEHVGWETMRAAERLQGQIHFNDDFLEVYINLITSAEKDNGKVQFHVQIAGSRYSKHDQIKVMSNTTV